MNQTVTLFHGTSNTNLESIKQKGLNMPFLSTDPESAREWAGNYYGYEEACVLTVEVDTDHLIPDYNQDHGRLWDMIGIEQTDIRGEDLTLFLQKTKQLNIPWNSVQEEFGGQAAIYVGVVKPNNIIDVECPDNLVEEINDIRRRAGIIKSS